MISWKLVSFSINDNPIRSVARGSSNRPYQHPLEQPKSPVKELRYLASSTFAPVPNCSIVSIPKKLISWIAIPFSVYACV